MLAGADQDGPRGDDQREPHPLAALIPDPTGKPPLCDEPRFAEILARMVADAAPRMFAVVQEYGDRYDARIAAWGLAHAEHSDVVDFGGSVHLGLHTPESALRMFGVTGRLTPRLVWVDPALATPDDLMEESDER
ncbi:hypothetical protein [Actinokineospora sp.]|uniref:hypothetical protein n=1 Tax=Actinokineospora sp. TaxID=1872133 RepID=UPI00403837E1